MQYLWAFLVGGLLCAIGQLIIDGTRLTAGHTMVLYVVAGAALAGLGLYEPLVRFAGAGAAVPVSNFGYVLTKGIVDHLRREGWWGALSGTFEVAGAVTAASILFGVVMAVIFHPRG
ncbi:SpoVA/SpoVAEb family sporulation membrane protein [Carboxydochorda subterranea]|uniref:SpoVA/SpoVAEb family sporulation membrane protein n=1 Tax=Carboxydichorda subterranea TaxID=3109565 RepID=A0ABZ1C115_9FIRM|nr:SpoVA/SpoVAEb family sporulation membrane protein [Limnochorda sp. L945t]WRP18573.1 SpoVA/SpoVAEb family sporulation membrane protein [Limnochorda sp. L945t]